MNRRLLTGVALVVVAASGNDGQELMQFPAGYSGVITVGATNGRDEQSSRNENQIFGRSS